MAENTVIRGSRPRELPRPNRVYTEGRICSNEGCETRISKYNKAQFCWTHAPLRYPLTRGERKKRSTKAA